MQLSIVNLTKIYRNGVIALDNLDLEIGAGMFGLLGPNGAGKSTLMRTIATLQQPDSGSIFFNGIDVLNTPMQLRKMLGYLPQEFGVYPNISAEKLLDYFATLKGISTKNDRKRMIGAALEITNLTDVRRKNVSEYSGGMKQRFGIAQLLLNAPKLIIVDEPTAGLDPAERQRFLNVLREIGTSNTVIFSTHIVDDVTDLCTDLAIMNGGKILQHSTPENATSALAGKIWTKSIARNMLEVAEKQYLVLSSNFNADHSLTIRVYAESQPASDFSPEMPQLADAYFLVLKNADFATNAQN